MKKLLLGFCLVAGSVCPAITFYNNRSSSVRLTVGRPQVGSLMPAARILECVSDGRVVFPSLGQMTLLTVYDEESNEVLWTVTLPADMDLEIEATDSKLNMRPC